MIWIDFSYDPIYLELNARTFVLNITLTWGPTGSLDQAHDFDQLAEGGDRTTKLYIYIIQGSKCSKDVKWADAK